MRVYHLLAKKWALCDLKHRRLKVATFDNLNDPFELRGANLADRDQRRRFNRWRREAARRLGLMCFSKSWRNPVLWSHYADEHKGIALGFDVPENCLEEVEYVPQRLRYEQLVPQEHELRHLLRTKYKDWEYEGEHRRIVSLKETSKCKDLHFWPFASDLELREVVLGARCKAMEEDLERLMGDLFASISLVQARPAFQTFNVVTDQRGIR